MRLSTAPTGEPHDVVLEFDSTHWARQGLVRFDLVVDDDDTVVKADLVAGFMHRGAEKLFEVRDYRSGLALANRHDWLAPICGEVLMARAAEDLLGMAVPERARWIRVLLIEATRVAALLALTGPAAEPMAMPDSAAVFAAAARHRESVLALLEELTGARMHVTATAIGGMRVDPENAWCQRLVAAIDSVANGTLPLLTQAVESAPFHAHCDARGVVSVADAEGFGAAGVVGRASGVDREVRRSDIDYRELRHLLAATPLNPAGDAATRLNLLVRELASAVDLVRAAAERVIDLAGSAVSLPLPKVLRVPIGTSVQWIETPLGASCAVLESRGDRAPARYALRTPSAAHAPLLAQTLCGYSLSSARAIVSSFPIVVGDLDR